MSSAGLIASLVIVFVGAAWVLFPILQQAKRKAQNLTRERDELLTQYERVLSAIRDLDEDFQTGKLDAETYQDERTQWSQRGVRILQQLEQPGSTVTENADVPASPQNQPADDELEALIARYAKSKT